jgi:hypothetical protein
MKFFRRRAVARKLKSLVFASPTLIQVSLKRCLNWTLCTAAMLRIFFLALVPDLVIIQWALLLELIEL